MMKILFATDGSVPATATEDFLIEITKPESVSVDIVSVVPSPQYAAFGVEGNAVAAEIYHEVLDSTRHSLKQSTQKFHEAHWDATSHLKQGPPATAILEYTKSMAADLVAVGSHGASLVERFLLASVSSKILRHAGCSVLIHRGPAIILRKSLRILLAHDGSDYADQAMMFLKTYPWKYPLQVFVVRVIELVEAFNTDAIQRHSNSWKSEVKATQQAIEEVKAKLSNDQISADGEVHQDQNVAHVLLRISEEKNPDLIVMGHQGRGAMAQFFLGSIAYRVAEHAKCAVLVVR